MELQQKQRQETKLILNHTMRQSLAVLRMSLTELQEYVENAILENPLLELGERKSLSNEEDSDVLLRVSNESEGSLADCRLDFQGLTRDIPGLLSEETFTDMLIEQLLEIRGKEAQAAIKGF